MDQPDYANYTEQQLRQARNTLDTERYPERLAQIDARLAEIAAQAPAAPAAAAPLVDTYGYLPIMRRTGTVLMAAGLLDLGLLLLCMANGRSYSSSISFFGVFAGMLLRGGSLRVAVVLRWLATLSLPTAVATGLLLFVQPLDLTWTQIRLMPFNYFGTVLLAAAQVALPWWMIAQLGREPILAARRADGRKAYDMRKPLAAGLLLALMMMGFFYLLLLGGRGQRAEQLARQQYGERYRYHANGINILNNGSEMIVNGSVVVWDHDHVGVAPVSWKE